MAEATVLLEKSEAGRGRREVVYIKKKTVEKNNILTGRSMGVV